jgi:hypothetical protein
VCRSPCKPLPGVPTAWSKAEFAKDGGRLSNWLKHLDAFRAKAGGGSGFLCAGHPTAADFFLVSAFDALDFSLGPEATAGITPDGLKAWRALMEARPSFAAFKAQAKPALFPRMAAPKKVMLLAISRIINVGRYPCRTCECKPANYSPHLLRNPRFAS